MIGLANFWPPRLWQMVELHADILVSIAHLAAGSVGGGDHVVVPERALPRFCIFLFLVVFEFSAPFFPLRNGQMGPVAIYNIGSILRPNNFIIGASPQLFVGVSAC